MRCLLQVVVNVIPYPCRGWIKHIPLLKQLQQLLMENHFKDGHFKHRIKGGPADGLTYPIELPEDKGIWLGNYEQSFSEALAAAVGPGTICYDIGGFRGFFTGVMACQGARVVHVFEPFPGNLD